MRQAVTVKDDKGRLVAMYHGKCHRLLDRAETKARYGIGGSNAPAVESVVRHSRDDESADAKDLKARQEAELTALKERQQQLAAQRELESAGGAFDDWRDPVEIDLDDIL